MPSRETYGLFTPRLFSVHLAVHPPAGVAKYFAGSVKNHLLEAQRDFPHLSPDDRIDLLFYATAGAHELKHYHDMISTDFGFTYCFSRLSLEMELCHTLTRFAETRSSLRIPFLKWRHHTDCPSEIRVLCDRYASHYEMENALFYPASFPAEKAQIPGLILARPLPGCAQLTPVVNFGYQYCKQNGVRHHYYPLNALSLLESSAFCFQGVQVSDLFGKEATDFFAQMYQRELFRSDLWVYYLSAFLISYALRRFDLAPTPPLVSALHDFAFMGHSKSVGLTQEVHPGWRLGALLSHLIYDKTAKIKSEADLFRLLDWFDEERLQMPSRKERFQKRYDDIDRVCILMGLDSGYTGIQSALDTIPQVAMLKLASMCRKAFKIRIEDPSLFADPLKYLCNLQNLPLPPTLVLEEDGYTILSSDIFGRVRGYSPEEICSMDDAHFWSLYFVASTLLDRIFQTGKGTCPFSDVGIPCPFYSSACADFVDRDLSHSRCVFGDAIRSLGLERVRFQYVS